MRTKLRLLRLIINGDMYKRILDIDESLVIIKGDGFSGKSLVLNLIAYCLGSKAEIIDLSVQTELAKYCDEVFLEFRIGEKIYTVNRKLKNDRNMIQIYLCGFDEHEEYSPWKKKVEDANDFFAEQLQIPLHSILRKKSGTNDLNQEKISFRDFMRFVFVHQGELGTNQFLQNNNTFISGKNKEVFKIINDLIITDIEEINKKIQIIQNEHNRIAKINDGLKDYLSNRKAVDSIELIKIRDEFSNKVNELTRTKKELVAKNRNDNSKIFINLKSDITEADEKAHEINEDMKILELSINNKEILLNDYFDELEKLKATLEALKKVKISEQSQRCPLCHTIVEIKKEKYETSEDIEKAVDQIEDKVETLKNLIEIDDKKLAKQNEELKKIYEKRKIYASALNEYKKNMEVPYLSEIESINSLIKNITENKNKINSFIDIHNEVDANGLEIVRLGEQLETFKKKKNELIKSQKREENILLILNKKYRKLMERFNFTSIQEDKCYISKDNYLPHYNGISVLKHTSGCLLLCMQIAYLGSILELNVEEENNCHPAVLMLDTVSNNIGTNSESKDSIDPETYAELFKYLVEISKDNQVFIIDNTPPQISEKNREFIFRRVSDGEILAGLIDLSKNEIKLDK